MAKRPDWMGPEEWDRASRKEAARAAHELHIEMDDRPLHTVVFDAQSRILGVASDMRSMASSFDHVGNTRVAEFLEDAAQALEWSIREVSSSVSRDLGARAAQSRDMAYLSLGAAVSVFSREAESKSRIAELEAKVGDAA